MFATHYHELTQLEGKISNVKNYCIAVKKHGGTINFLRKIVRGGADESYGVDVAALAGVKDSVVKRAKEIVASLEREESREVRDARVITAAEKKTVSDTQIGFMSGAAGEICAELKGLDLNSMTPVQAMTVLYELQAKAKNEMI